VEATPLATVARKPITGEQLYFEVAL
jgi:hypothetical protein